SSNRRYLNEHCAPRPAHHDHRGPAHPRRNPRPHRPRGPRDHLHGRTPALARLHRLGVAPERPHHVHLPRHGCRATEARATQRAAEAARIHEQLHAITRLRSRRWTYEIDGVEMTYKRAIRALISKGVPEIHAHDWLSGIGYKAEEEDWW